LSKLGKTKQIHVFRTLRSSAVSKVGPVPTGTNRHAVENKFEWNNTAKHGTN